MLFVNGFDELLTFCLQFIVVFVDIFARYAVTYTKDFSISVSIKLYKNFKMGIFYIKHIFLLLSFVLPYYTILKY